VNLDTALINREPADAKRKDRTRNQHEREWALLQQTSESIKKKLKRKKNSGEHTTDDGTFHGTYRHNMGEPSGDLVRKLGKAMEGMVVCEAPLVDGPQSLGPGGWVTITMLHGNGGGAGCGEEGLAWWCCTPVAVDLCGGGGWIAPLRISGSATAQLR
jgi:hypothetical protein